MFVILTGGIGCGKTTVLNEFRRLGISCFVADEVAAHYYDDPAFVLEVDRALGGGMVMADGSADKRAIARRVFSDPQALAKLNAMVHPRVWNDFLLFARQHPEAPYILFESAIAYEYGFDRLADKVVCVYLDKAERMRRLALRDKVSEAELEARMRNQLSAEEKLMRADYVILNYEGNPRRRQVEYVHRQLLCLSGVHGSTPLH